MTRPARRRPRGFTMVELMVVLVILAILVALLVPAVLAAVKTARAAAVQAEINQLAQALADFKSKYGDYPPSRILLSENGWLNTSNTAPVSSNASADITYGQLAQRSITALRKFWPRVTMSPTSAVWASGSSVWYDFNGDGSFQFDTLGGAGPNGFLLSGHECLTFFLGGLPQRSATGVSVSGFGKDPTNPFKNAIATSNRTTPLFEFNVGRLVVVSQHGIPGYIDSINGAGTGLSFYAYFSTNLGTGYDPNDENTTETDGNGLSPIGLRFHTSFPVTDGSNVGTLTLSPGPNPYTGTPTAGTGVATVTYLNPQSFQIISPGSDGLYGVGGVYTPNTTSGSVLPTENVGGTFPNSNSSDANLRSSEGDNLTNFHQGKLN